jgi:hypothetical protein
MICPSCRAEYRVGFTVCADCETALVPALDERAEPEVSDALEPLHETRNPEELGELAELLEEARVPYVVQAGTALALLAGDELVAPGEPDAWEARVLVSAPHHARAGRLLAELRAARAAGFAAIRRPSAVRPE